MSATHFQVPSACFFQTSSVLPWSVAGLPWDHHDEFFYVVNGQLLIDLEDQTVKLDSGQGFVVPQRVVHRTRAPHRTVVLMVENKGILPTGDPQEF